jgi:type I restriction enzyme S subunit
MMKYHSYKDSGIDWLGEKHPIPKHWSVKRVKDLGNYQSGSFIDASEMDIENPYPVYGGNGIRGLAKKYNHNGDYILIGRQGALCGNINYASGKFWATEHAVVVYKKKEYNLTWLGELFRVMNFNQYSLSAAQPGLSVDRIKRLELPIPTVEEQTAIANYLDTKTQAIDKKVSLLEKKIGYYQELRKSLINETVTKGLDKNAELQTNELGFATPKNWLRYRLKDLGALYSGLSGKSGDDFNQDDNPDNKGFIPFTNIANNTYLKRDHLGTVVVYEGEKQNRVRKGDIFFLMSSEGYEDIGKSAALAEDIEETYLNSFCKGYRVNPRKTNPYFLNYLMLSDYYRQLLIVEGKGFTRINLKMEKVNDFLVYIPDTLSAQDEIVKFLDAKLDTIAKIISNIQTQITTLKELRKTLINDVVTGKIKVSHE